MIPGLEHGVKRPGIATAVAWVIAVAHIQPLSQDLPEATGAAINKKKKKNVKQIKSIMSVSSFCPFHSLAVQPKKH